MLTELKKLTCICCGGELTGKDGKLVCKYCKSTFEEVEKISEEEVLSLNRASTDRNLLRFDEALEEYNLLLKKYPHNEMASWGAFLSDYGIIYEQDYNNEYIPTCHRLNERPVIESPNFAGLSAEHKENANEIEKLRLSIMEKAKKIQPYDVFICYKATEEKRGVSVPTREASWARDIYELLTKKGLRVFFAEKSLAGSNVDYEPHIYSALRSAKLMFVLAGSIEHVNATWVANEWKRYAKYVRDGEEKTLRVVYDFINPYDLPKVLQNKQAIDHNDMGWVEAVQQATDDIFEIKQETPEWQKAMEEMRERMNASAEHGEVIADKYCAKCYAPQAKHIKFCGECGNKEFIVAPDGVKYCLDCGSANQIKQKFCHSCGKNKFVYTKEDYQKEVERREQERLAAEERARQAAEKRERERIAAEERARQAAEKRERERIAAEERAKKTKKIISIVVIALVVIISSVFTIFYIDSCVRNGLTMELSADKSYYIVTDCLEDKMEAIIPDSYNGKPVKKIAKNTFASCSRLTSVTIGNGVISIDSYAFYDCDSLTSVTIGKGVTSIGDSAFSSCESLTSIIIPDSVTSIDKYVFNYCTSLTSITIPDSVTNIGYGAFYNCDSLKRVTIPDSVTSIGGWAFYDCDTLTSLTISNGVTSIGESAFSHCDSLMGVTIPDSVKSISGRAFYSCNNLKSITIGNGVTGIGDSAFYSCDNLTSIKFNGTKELWNKISKGSDWKNEIPATYVQCTDGTVAI